MITYLRRSLLLLSLFGLSSCSFIPYFGVGAAPSPSPGYRVEWPNRSFSEVRAYCYDYTADDQVSFMVNGQMHRGVLDPAGVKLTRAQTERFLAAITTSLPKQKRTPCYKPHHAFVLYGADKQIVAVFEMCFGCNQFRETPNGLPEYVDTAVLYTLCQELGLPLGANNEYYQEVCRRNAVR